MFREERFVESDMYRASAVKDTVAGSVLELIQTQAKARPKAIAVASGIQKLTYGELNDRSTKLAALLRSRGVGTDARVAICLHRSPAFVIAALGILKAGAAFVPLDPGDPKNRLAMLLEDSEAEFVVTHQRAAGLLPAGRWETLLLGDDGSVPIPLGPTDGSTDLTRVRVMPEDLAYVIFTSGSTGRPKGVQITHANLLNLVGWHVRAFGVTASDRATMQASPGFDAAVWELFPYLCAGASVRIIDDRIRTTPGLLRDWMVANGISISFVPTAVAESLIALPWPPNATLRVLLTGADVLRRYPPPGLPFVLVNNYGPTECTVVATSGVVPPNPQSNLLPPIGRPIDNVEIYIVDEDLNQVPLGASGELLIGGAGVGRGYLNPELNAKKIIQNPFSPGKSCLYRTGDLARQLPDGQIAFLGRIDEQLKIRGYRIEPGEISAVLNRHPAVESSLVTVQTNTSGEPGLVAYIVAKQSADVRTGELRTWLADRLPAYMVPAAFVGIDSLPTTSRGKVDRTALPLPTPENTLSEDVFEAPQSELERWLAGYLTRLLGVREIGRNDNFFRLGGHSLMGAQLVAEIQRTYDVELSLRSLFDHPTVAGIASEIETLIHAHLNAMSDAEAQHLLESISARGSV
jgi:amino acid adenylation domain-containing protein